MTLAHKQTTDYVLLVFFSILVIFGLLMLTSAAASIGYDRFGDRFFFVKRQLLYGVLPGIVAFLLMAKIPYQVWSRYYWLVYGATIIILCLVFIPGLGTTLDTGSHSWIQVGNISVQPSEFAKLGFILFLAAYLSHSGRQIRDVKKGFLFTLIFGFIPIGLVLLQPDVGTASIFFGIFFGMVFLSGAKLWHIAGLALAGVAGFVAMIAIAPYRAARLMTFLHPELDPLGIGYHINQAFLAIGSGGWFGLGYGHSRQKFEYLPEVHGDSIFAIIAEELGVIFAAGFIILLLLAVIRGLRIGKYAPDQYGRLLSSGIMIWFIVQSFLNIGAMVGLMPLTGIPLPFISHGGTALLVAFAAVGVVINISKQQKKYENKV